MSGTWPVAEVGPVRRLRIMAASIPGTCVAERVVPAAFDEVWAKVSHIESAMPALITDIRECRVRALGADRLEMTARGYLGQRAVFEVVLRPGWCFMRSRFLVGGMAAEPEGDATRFAFLGGSRLLGFAGPVLPHLLEPQLERVARRVERMVAMSRTDLR